MDTTLAGRSTVAGRKHAWITSRVERDRASRSLAGRLEAAKLAYNREVRREARLRAVDAYLAGVARVGLTQLRNG